MKINVIPKIKLDMEVVGVTWINDDNFKEMIKNPDEIIINDEKIHIRYDYPIKRITFKHFHSKKGFTKYELYKCIYEGYEQLKDEGMIILHVLEHLVIEEVIYSKFSQTCLLHIGS